MSYIDPENTGSVATEYYITDPTVAAGVGTTHTASVTGVTIDGTNYVVVERNADLIEILTIDPDTLEMTFHQAIERTTSEVNNGDEIEWVVGNDGEIYGLDSTVKAPDAHGHLNLLKFNSTTGMFEYTETDVGDILPAGTTNTNTTASDVFQAQDGNIYALVELNSGDGNLGKYMFDTDTQTWSLVDQISGFDYGRDGTIFNTQHGNNLHVITNEETGEQWLMADTLGADAAREGIEFIKLDATGTPVSSFFVNDADLPGGQFFGDLIDNYHYQPEVDANGNIVLAAGSHGSFTAGIVVIDPGTGQVVYSIDEGATDPTTGQPLFDNIFNGDGDITFSEDGRYMYVTSQATSGSLESTTGTHTAVIDTRYPDGTTDTYALVAHNTDNTAGLDETTPAPISPSPDPNALETEILTFYDANGDPVNVQINVTRAAGPSSQLVVTASETLLSEDVFNICFAAGTRIKAKRGQVLVEDLEIGDLVKTADHGYQPIRWIGSSVKPAMGDVAPILIKKGALDNRRDLRVSPQHRMLITGWRAELLFGASEILVPAKHLVNDHSIIREEGGTVEYFHILFDTHELVLAEGTWSESFYLGEQGEKALSREQRSEILTLFPELEGRFDNYDETPARPILKSHQGRALSAAKPLAN